MRRQPFSLLCIYALAGRSFAVRQPRFGIFGEAELSFVFAPLSTALQLSSLACRFAAAATAAPL